MSIQSYRDLIAWQKAVDLAVVVYNFTNTFPREETYGLTSQMRRAAVSIASNVAEGRGRSSRKDFGNFLAIAYGSLSELETQAIIAERLKYVSRDNRDSLLTTTAEVGRLIHGLANAIKRPPKT